MRRVAFCSLAFLILGAASLLAQSSTGGTAAQAAKAAPKPPDLVCFGNQPNWSIQFTANGARYIAMNEPERGYIGSFHWIPDMNAWSWNPTDLGQKEPLTAVIKKQSCVDPVRKWTVPYSAQVNLPHGDMASGCCRKLKPGEAPVGPGGYGPPPQQ